MQKGTLKLPRLLSDGMVIQRRKRIHIWGWDEPGCEIRAELDGITAKTVTKENGRFDLYLPAKESGGPYELVIEDSEGNRITVSDVLVGLVWFCTGQSNMELPINRVRDTYPRLKDIAANNTIRTFKIVESTNYHNPLEELETGEWVCVDKDTIMDFSATGYFFAENLQKLTGQTVGIINATLGGSRISSWMSRDMLEGYDELLAEADKYADDDFMNSVIENNAVFPEKWRKELDAADKGLSEHWENPALGDNDWEQMNIPVMFKDTELSGMNGAVWFRKKFDLPTELAGKPARLFLGTMVDRDYVFVNGTLVGNTEYQYPPRKYDIPEGLTKKEGNTVVIRLCVENGYGRITPDKEYKIFNEEAETYLDGEWKFKVAATCGPIPPTDFVNWKPTGLYNAMTAPCHNFPIDGVLWYQGESNTHEPYDYVDLTKRQIAGYRAKWGEENLPYIFVQLPNFVIDVEDVDDPWPEFRIDQTKLLKKSSVEMVVTMDVGEDNDLHPTVKEPIGRRLALCAARLKYGYNGEYSGPVPEGAVIKTKDSSFSKEEKNSTLLEISFAHAEGLKVKDIGKGRQLKDFEVVDKEGNIYSATAEIKKEKIIVTAPLSEGKIDKVRYLVKYTYTGGMIYNGADLPMGPFEINV